MQLRGAMTAGSTGVVRGLMRPWWKTKRKDEVELLRRRDSRLQCALDFQTCEVKGSCMYEDNDSLQVMEGHFLYVSQLVSKNATETPISAPTRAVCSGRKVLYARPGWDICT